MKQARCAWIVLATVVPAGLMIAGCGSTSTGTSGGGAAKPGVKISSEPMSATGAAASAGGALTARAVLQPGADTAGFSGMVTFTQQGDQVHVVANLAVVSPAGNHGFHIHEHGVCERDPAGKHFTTAGGHFNPGGVPHACPDTAQHHAGDLGNVVIQADGTGHVDVTTSDLTLTGPNSVIGKAVILHAGSDDCTTQPTGNAGGRLACGVITAAAAASGH